MTIIKLKSEWTIGTQIGSGGFDHGVKSGRLTEVQALVNTISSYVLFA
jgi:hypothetical protein